MLNNAAENVRRLAEWGRESRDVDLASFTPREIRSVGIIGVGTMGASIAAAHVRHGIPVFLHDTNAATLEHATAVIADELREAGFHRSEDELRRWTHPTNELAIAAQCDLVVEAIAETPAAKLQLYANLRKHMGEWTLVASNTSTIPLQRLAVAIDDPSRFFGLHFCHPVQHRPLVEIVRGPQTSDASIAAAIAHTRRIDRIHMVVRDGPGFVVNRLLFPYLGEALTLLREGVPAETIERAAADFGMAIGPLGLMDEIGLDTILQAAWVLAAAFPERIVSSPMLVSLVKAGRLGRKTGAGFFAYRKSTTDDAPGVADPAATEILTPWIDAIEAYEPASLSYRLVLPMVLEATRILEENAVGDMRDIELAVLFGLGFPASKGGLLWWADTLGVNRIVELLRGSSARGDPTPLLLSMVENHTKFYDGQ
jgi:3-hydroxyacyl-CoA dehydrogenase